MKKYQEKTWNKTECRSSALKITTAELKQLTGITDEEIAAGKQHGTMKTVGPWSLVKSYQALAMSTVYTPKERQRYSAECESVTAYGMRTMSNPVQSGYCLEGYVSIHGIKYSAFTSSQLFELEYGKLVDIATLQIRLR